MFRYGNYMFNNSDQLLNDISNQLSNFRRLHHIGNAPCDGPDKYNEFLGQKYTNIQQEYEYASECPCLMATTYRYI